MKKQYVLLLLLLCCATLGALAQDGWRNPVQLSFSTQEEHVKSITICNGGGVTLSVSLEESEGEFSYTLQSTSDISEVDVPVNFQNVEGVTLTPTVPINLPNITTEGVFYYRVALNNQQEDIYSDTVMLTVLSPFTAGTISISGQKYVNTCSGTRPGELSIDESYHFSCGHVGFTYQWQDSTNSGAWQDIDGSTDSIYTPADTLSVDHWYRLVAHNTGCDESVVSDTVHVHIYGGITTSPIVFLEDSVVCNGGSINLTATEGSSSDAVVSIGHEWQYKVDSDTVWTSVNGDFTTSYTRDNLTDTTYFRVKAYTECDTMYSDSVRVVVLPPFQPGTIAFDTAEVCYNSPNHIIHFDISPVGTKDAVTFQWHTKLVNGLYGQWADGDSIYTTGAMTDPTVFQAQVINVCGSGTTNEVTINVAGQLYPANLPPMPAICAGATPDPIVMGTTPQFRGGIGDFTYVWQSSTSSLNGPWDTIPDITATVYQPGALNVTTWYHVIGHNQCGDVTTASTQIYVYPQPTAPHIALPEIDTICFGTTVESLTIDTASVIEGINVTYVWEKTTDTAFADSSWVDIEESTITIYPDPMTQSTAFRVYAKPANNNIHGCVRAYSTDTVHITVLPQFLPGNIVADDTVLCNGFGTRVAFDTMPSGADGTYSISWQYSIDGNVFDDLTGFDTVPSFDTVWNADTTEIVSIAYSTPNLDSTIFYRAIVSNQRCGDSLPTDSVRIQVFAPFMGSDIHVMTGSEPLATCWGTVPEGISFAHDTVATGGSGNYAYRWHTSATDTLSESDDPYAPVDTLTSATIYYFTTIDLVCDTSHTSNGITIDVNPLPEVPTLGGDTAFLCSSTMPLRYWVLAEDSMFYQWNSNSASFSDNKSDSSVVYLTWNSGLDNVSLDLTLTFATTGCSRTVTFDNIPINTNATAPDTTDILIKFGGNILVCNDDAPNAKYEWGYTDRTTGIDNPYLNSNSRYYQTPDAIDTASRDYYVIIQHGDVPCKTRSYYVPRSEAPVVDPTDEVHMVVSPNPSMGDVYYSLDVSVPGAYTVSVFDAVGQLLFTQEATDYVQDVPVLIGRHLHQGIYVVSVATANNVVSQKIIVK